MAELLLSGTSMRIPSQPEVSVAKIRGFADNGDICIRQICSGRKVHHFECFVHRGGVYLTTEHDFCGIKSGPGGIQSIVRRERILI